MGMIIYLNTWIFKSEKIGAYHVAYKFNFIVIEAFLKINQVFLLLVLSWIKLKAILFLFLF